MAGINSLDGDYTYTTLINRPHFSAMVDHDTAKVRLNAENDIRFKSCPQIGLTPKTVESARQRLLAEFPKDEAVRADINSGCDDLVKLMNRISREWIDG